MDRRTVAELVGSRDGAGRAPAGREAMKKRLAEAEARLRRFQTAIEAGVEPVALVEAEAYARIDSLGDVGTVFSDAGRRAWTDSCANNLI